MQDTLEFLKRAADRCGFKRDYHIDKNIPVNSEGVVVVHFFGDLRHEFVLSSLLLKRFRDELRGSKYMILCGWGGHRGLFPYVDEYWSPSDESSSGALRREALGFENHSELYTCQRQNLNFFFQNIITPDDLNKFYDGGLTAEFHQRLGVVKRYLPVVPSASYLGQYFNQEMVNRPGIKVLLMPTKYGRGYVHGRLTNIRSCIDFWRTLILRLSKGGYCPVVVNNHYTWDLSGALGDRAIFVQEEDVSKVLGMMRAVGCVLDVFNGSSRLAIAARTPYVAVDERGRFAAEREFEVDDLCAAGLPKQYIFSFPTILEGGDPAAWDGSLFDAVVSKLDEFVPSLDRNTFPSTSESVVEVPFSVVKERKAKRIGTRFVKIPKD